MGMQQVSTGDASVLLALGVRLGVPWIVTPVEAVVALLAMAYTTRRLLGERDVLVVVFLLGVAPLFAFQAASFYSHTAATMWLALAFAAVATWSVDQRSSRLALAGVALGCALLTRPFDGALFGGTLVLAALLGKSNGTNWRAVREAIRPAAVVVAGAAPFLVMHFAYQAAQFGSPWHDGYSVYEPTFRAIDGARTAASPLSLANIVDGTQFWHHLDIVRSFLVDWTVPGSALLAALGAVALAGDARVAIVRRCAVLIALAFAASLFVAIGGPDDGARPRYLSTVLIPLAFRGAPGWRSASELLALRLGVGLRRVIAVVVWVVPIIQLGAFLVTRTIDLRAREGLPEALAAAGVGDGVVIVRAEHPSRFARNGQLFDGPVLFVSAPASSTVDDIAIAFPGRPLYEAHEGGAGSKWSLSRVR